MRTSLTYLYRCFDREGQLLYVGITDNVEQRLRRHAAEKYWWPDVIRTTRMAFPRRIEALWAEWAVITTCSPLYNGTATVPDGDFPQVNPVPPGASPRIRNGVRVVEEGDRPLKTKAIKRLRRALEAQPNASNAELAATAGVSRGTANRYLPQIRSTPISHNHPTDAA